MPHWRKPKELGLLTAIVIYKNEAFIQGCFLCVFKLKCDFFVLNIFSKLGCIVWGWLSLICCTIELSAVFYICNISASCHQTGYSYILLLMQQTYNVPSYIWANQLEQTTDTAIGSITYVMHYTTRKTNSRTKINNLQEWTLLLRYRWRSICCAVVWGIWERSIPCIDPRSFCAHLNNWWVQPSCFQIFHNITIDDDLTCQNQL